MNAWKAAFASVAVAMAVGTVLGTFRELVVRRWLSGSWAIAAETPLMLAVCWFAVAWAMRRYRVEARAATRLRMGAAILVLQVLAEDLLTRGLRGGSVLQHWAGYDAPALAFTVLGLVAFAAMPWLHLRVPLGRRG